MKRALFVLAALGVAAVLAGCGGGKKAATTTTSSTPPVLDAMTALQKKEPKLAGTAKTLFQETYWAVVVVQKGATATAVAFHRVKGVWVADQTGAVKVVKLGKQTGTQPQIAAAISAKQTLIDTGLWIDSVPLVEHAVGTTTSGTIYGAPTHKLKHGTYVAVAYARTGAGATALAWTFTT